jgi:uncharacterized membrane protein YdjX (TVP38/TMEM64 family)
MAVYAVVIVGATWALSDEAFRQHLSPKALAEAGRSLLAMPMGPALVLLGYVVAALMAMPVAVLITAGALIFGPWPGMAYALVGMVCGSAATYGVGRFMGAQAVDGWSTHGKLHAFSELVKRKGLWAIILIRAFPIAPFVMINLAAGALRVRLRDFVLGTFIGLAPGTVVLSLFTDQLAQALASPEARGWLGWGGAAVVLALLAWHFWRRRRTLA